MASDALSHGEVQVRSVLQAQMGPQLSKHAPIDGVPGCLLHGGLKRLCRSKD